MGGVSPELVGATLGGLGCYGLLYLDYYTYAGCRGSSVVT